MPSTGEPLHVVLNRVRVWIPGRIINAKNVSGLGLWKHRRMIRSARQLAANYLLKACLEQPRQHWPWGAMTPKRITFSAHLRRLLDDDSLPFALSPYRDALGDCGLIGKTAGTAHGPGRVMDAPGDGHHFIYQQQVAAASRGEAIGVEITVEAR